MYNTITVEICYLMSYIPDVSPGKNLLFVCKSKTVIDQLLTGRKCWQFDVPDQWEPVYIFSHGQDFKRTFSVELRWKERAILDDFIFL